jgi:hypothetical protein
VSIEVGAAMSGNTTSHELRFLVCPSCGAPVQALPQGGHVQCRYCQVVLEVRPRIEVVEDRRPPPEPSRPDTEEQRLALLRDQISSTDPYALPPSGLRALMYRTSDPAALSEIQQRWRAARAAVSRGEAGAEAELYWASVMLRTQHAHDLLTARAVTETALEAIHDPVFRTLLRISLAARACDAGDVRAAEAWLAPVDPRPTVLGVHTDLALARAKIALLRQDWSGVFAHLGPAADQIPIALADDALACMMRATAYEGLGDLPAARAALWAVGRNLGGKLFGPGKVLWFCGVYPNLRLCTQTYAAFRFRVTLIRATLALIALAFAAALVGAVLQS